MKLERIVLRQIRMPLVHFFETSFGRTTERHMVLVEAVGESVSGWGEVTAGENPFYNEEWTHSAWQILRDYAAPLVRAAADVEEVGRTFTGASWRSSAAEYTDRIQPAARAFLCYPA